MFIWLKVLEEKFLLVFHFLYNVENDPLTYSYAMASHGSASWKEAIDDEMQSIMGNNTWV